MERKTIENDLDYLRQVSSEVDFSKDDYLEYINNLREFCRNNEVYALAPVQIGIPKRIIYIKNTNEDMDLNKDSSYDEEVILINPIIIKREGHTRFLEKCASCMDLVGVVDRPYLVEVEYFDINKNKKRDVFTEFSATVFSHEYDHLDGVLHIDKALEVIEMNREETREYRINNPYKIISKTGCFKENK